MKFLILSPQETTQQRLVKKTEKGETLLSDVNSFFSEPLPIGKTHNDLSIVVFLKVGEATVLLTGDIEEKGELSLIKWGLLSKTDILKVAHHGAKTSTSRSFIEVVQPEISVISVGANNSYGHPADRVLSLLQDYESQIIRTDREGTIVYQLGENGRWFKDEARAVDDFFWQLFRF
jgi:competence protein ComEC